MAKQKITYSTVGDNYETKDPIKKLAQESAARTGKNLESHGFQEVSETRGESAYVWRQGESYMASVIEGLGTKNLIADAMRQITGKTYYDVIAHDTVATVINDLVSVGATPLVLHAYWAIEDNEWLQDKERMTDLIKGWEDSCNIAGVSWGGGETPTMKQIVHPGTCELGGSAVGIVSEEKYLLLDKNLQSGDRIILIKSNGVNANGISLTRAVADQLPDGYATKLPNGILYGDALLTRSNIYSRLIQNIQKAGIHLHYVSYISGHGMRKVMRARGKFSYIIENLFEPQEVFLFLKDNTGLDEKEMYGTYNMGQDYALFLPQSEVDKVLEVINDSGFEGIDAGYIEEGERQVILKSKDITFSSSELNLR